MAEESDDLKPVTLRVRVRPDTRAMTKDGRDSIGVPSVEVVARLLECFVRQDKAVRREILERGEPVGEPVRLRLAELAAEVPAPPYDAAHGNVTPESADLYAPLLRAGVPVAIAYPPLRPLTLKLSAGLTPGAREQWLAESYALACRDGPFPGPGRPPACRG